VHQCVCVCMRACVLMCVSVCVCDVCACVCVSVCVCDVCACVCVCVRCVCLCVCVCVCVRCVCLCARNLSYKPDVIGDDMKPSEQKPFGESQSRADCALCFFDLTLRSLLPTAECAANSKKNIILKKTRY